MCPIRIIILVYFNGKRRDFTFSSQAERCAYSSARPLDGAAAVTFIKCLVCAEMWHHSRCETNTPIPPGLSCRSCRVATFPLPLWASQSFRDPSGHRSSSAWELEPGQIYSLMNSQQEEKLDKTYDYHTWRNTDGDGLHIGLPWPFSALWAKLVGCNDAKSRDLVCVGASVCVHPAWQRDVWQRMTLSVTLGLRVGILGARGVGRHITYTHTLLRRGAQQCDHLSQWARWQ